MKENRTRINLGIQLERQAKKTKQAIWSEAASSLLGSRKNRAAVNVSQISRFSSDGSRVLVPGKVLGLGTISHKVVVIAYSFSGQAREKIMKAGGQCVSIAEFAKSNSSVKDVKVLG